VGSGERTDQTGDVSCLAISPIPWGLGSWGPVFFSCCPALSGGLSGRTISRVVETRRLELLTLSLQRRCSAD
jgi:hypothetical protein